MLTATYSIVALKVEQKKARWNLSALQHTIMNSLRNLKNASGLDIESMLNRLTQFEQYCHQRKMEIFVIPALRKITHEADSLLEELDSLSSSSLAILRSLREKLQEAMRQGALKIDELCSSLELCCAHLYRRLTKEEELVQIAERVIPSDEWFGIAAKFMSHDAHASKVASQARRSEED